MAIVLLLWFIWQLCCCYGEPFDGSCCLFCFSPCESLVPGTV